MMAETAGVIVTIVVFAGLGWRVAARRSRRAGLGIFAALLVAALVGRFVGVGTRLVDVDGFRVPLDGAIVAFCLGACGGLLRRNRLLGRMERA